MGSTLALTNGAGTPTTTYTYDPFGTTTVTVASTNAFQFTSRENDGTGLYYYRARYYSPTFHRFLSEDPIGLAGGDENFYAYTFNSPTNFTDPSGEFVAPLIGCLGGIALDNILSGRKSPQTIGSAAAACAAGAVGGGAVGTAGKAALKGLGKLASRFGKSLPKNPNNLLKQGYKETTHADAGKAGHRTFENSQTGDKLRFDQGKPGASGHKGNDHYHRENPNTTGRHDKFLDQNGNPCANGCDASHLYP